MNLSTAHARLGWKAISIAAVATFLALFPTNLRAGLEDSFRNPPTSAQPWTYWFWINGNITKEGITADLEAMKRVGIAGVLIMEVANPNTMAPAGPVPFASPQWRELFKHVVSESRRLGLEVNMNNDAGWCGSGGPWMKPESSMQKLVSSTTNIRGPKKFNDVLQQPKSLEGYYRDIKVLAFRAPPKKNLKASIPAKSILDLTTNITPDGKLTWDVPQGDWRVLRIGCTTTGRKNKPAPVSGLGLECDKFTPEAMKQHFDAFISKLVDDVGPDAGKVFTSTHIDSWEVGTQDWAARFPEEFRKRRGYDLTPWLVVLAGGPSIGSPEETARFQWDFNRTRSELNDEAYAGALRELSHGRGLKLSIEAYGGAGFLNPLTYGAEADVPMAEFWIARWGAWHLLSPKLMGSVGHVYGKPVVGAESFTSWAESDPFTEHPYTVKTIGDWAFCEGINRFVFHRTAMNPWTNRVPGMSFAGYGWHVDPAQPWWEPGRAYMQYLARCQSMLQEGQFVADICRLVTDGENYGQRPATASLPEQYEHIPSGFNYDYVADRAVMQELSVKDGKIVTRSGMSYRLLQLPNSKTLQPELLKKIRDMVMAGAVVIGPKPEQSPSLQNYPKCDQEVKQLADELWGDCDGVKVEEHRLGSGRVIWGKPIGELAAELAGGSDFAFAIDPPMTEQSIVSITQGRGFQHGDERPQLMPTSGLNWMHRRDANTEYYFVANPQHRDVNALCTFRVDGMQPELWDPATGQIRKPAMFTNTKQGVQVPIHFDPAGSVFVVFQSKADSAQQIVELTHDRKVLFGAEQKSPVSLPQVWIEGSKTKLVFSPATAKTQTRYEAKYANGKRAVFEPTALPAAKELTGPWNVQFQPGRGAPDRLQFAALTDWSKHADPGIRYFSGTATYSVAFDWDTAADPSTRWELNLGAVQVMAEVILNGKEIGVLWKPPFAIDVTGALKSGRNHLEVKVANLWPNRLIGDEQFPDDCTPDGSWKQGKIPAWPEWVLKGQPRPEPRRLTFTTWKYYTKDSPLVPSGLLGPVKIQGASLVEVRANN